MLDFLFFIIIYPIRLILECIFTLLYTSIFKDNIGIALAGLSLAVSFFCLPMYAKAEQIQQLERNIQRKLAPKITVIKKVFYGDEQHFMLSMYYRENNYHPLYSLRSSLSLLVQIPFFIAAFSFLSKLDLLAGKSLFFINDLSRPDGLLIIFGLSINILPIIMTIINLSAGIIYSNNLLTKEKVQLYITPFIFLVLLYNSPSALVLYWTLNNIFSFFKTLFLKLKNPGTILYIIGCLFALTFTLYVLFFRYNAPDRAFRNKTIAIVILLLTISIPFILKGIILLKNKLSKFYYINPVSNHLFIASCLSILLLIGFFVPANIISSDPSQFLVNNINPLTFLYFSFIQGVGLLLFWPFLLFHLSSVNTKTIISLAASAVCLFFFANYFIFQANYGIISQTLNFSLISGQYLSRNIIYSLFNIFFFLLVLTFIFFIFILRKTRFIYSFLIALSLGTFAFGAVKIWEIQTTPLSKTQISLQSNNIDQPSNVNISLSRNGKNVIIIMLDGAISSYFPLFLEEKPELKTNFNGFTYYPNTTSFYRRTMFGVPPIFGGYEYSSYNINKRSDISIKEKQQEALTLLPLLFQQSGFSSYIADVPNSEFLDMPLEEYYARYNINANHIQNAFISKYLNEVLGKDSISSNAKIDELIKRNLLMLSLTVTIPYCIRDFIYSNGSYLGIADYQLDTIMSSSTLGGYTSLFYYPEITNFIENGNTFHMITNDLAHDRAFFQYPDYTLEENITDYGTNKFGNKASFMYYHVNAASYMLLSKWFDALREAGVWDNCRIIIVSDHGNLSLNNPGFTTFQNNYVIPYNPILLVKDFNQNDVLQINNDFMTNADVPLIALEGITENPVNPFTNKALVSEKSDGIYIYTQGYTNIKWYQGNTFLEDNSLFFYVHSNIFDSNNWTELRYRDIRRMQNDATIIH